MQRGDVWWASLEGDRRPVLIVQGDVVNRSRIDTVVVAMFTTNLRRARGIGNLQLTPSESGLPRDSVLNVSQLLTVPRTQLTEQVGRLAATTMRRVDQGLRLILEL